MFQRKVKSTLRKVIFTLKNTLERRLFLLKLEGDGLNKREIVKETCAKFGCSEVTAYNDFNTRAVWQPLVQEVTANLFKIQNRHEQLYRKASFMYAQARSDRARIAALNLMRQINIELAQLSGAKPSEQTQTEEIRIRWEDPEVCKKQYSSTTSPILDSVSSTSAPPVSECLTVAGAGAKPSAAPTN
ncbi:MAG: hypothetical protein ACQCN3_11355 [Candidatus Bathyarchaeia archaeon]|jgi:hypothetical protein